MKKIAQLASFKLRESIKEIAKTQSFLDSLWKVFMEHLLYAHHQPRD